MFASLSRSERLRSGSDLRFVNSSSGGIRERRSGAAPGPSGERDRQADGGGSEAESDRAVAPIEGVALRAGSPCCGARDEVVGQQSERPMAPNCGSVDGYADVAEP